MSYDTLEQSLESGEPIRLYAFYLGSRVWRYNTGTGDVMTTDGYVWKPAPISDDGVKQTGEVVSDAVMLTAPVDIAPIQVFLTLPPSSVMGISVFEKHRGDSEVRTIYVGDVSQVNFPEPGKATMTCETLMASMEREGLRLTWQRGCTHAVYDPVTCKVDKTLYAVPVTITAINGSTITVSGLGAPPDGRYSGGYIEWTNPVKGPEFMTIEWHSGSNFLIFGMTEEPYVGMQATAYRGCNLTFETCQEFNNHPNYGGVKNLPGKSPFEGLNAPFF